MMKQVILIWDLDGAIGQINSTFPYNFNYAQLDRELNNVKYALDTLDKYNVKCCFAITGFSAEQGLYPYTFPQLIKEISGRGHEIASHSWRHEWIPLFTGKQVLKSIVRSKASLENVIDRGKFVTGFVPPHNRPMTWLSKGAFSLGDRGMYPFFSMGDIGGLISLLRTAGYSWIRVSYRSIRDRLFSSSINITGSVYRYDGFLILKNHYTGFDQKVIDHILTTDYATYTVTAHPLMLDFSAKAENKENFENFLHQLTTSGQEIEFVTPSSLGDIAL